MRRAALFTMITFTSVATFGQALLDCVEPDVLRALLLQSQGETPPVITGAVPAELAPLKMPREFTWIGSAERITGRLDASTNATQATAAWRSSLPPEAARTTAAGALAASGWEVRSRPDIGAYGFTTAGIQALPQTACRDGKPVDVTASAMDGVTYLLIAIRRGINNPVCSQPARPMVETSSGLQRYMPRLEMPLDPASGTATGMQGSSGSSFGGSSLSADSRVDFTIKDSAANVARHFSRQMAEQGWTADTSWSGASTAGSSWSKRVDGSTRIVGTLLVTAFDESRFSATLRLLQLQ